MKKCDYNVSDTRFLYFTARERPRVFHVGEVGASWSHHFQKQVPKTDWQVASGDCSCKLLNYIVSNAREFARGLTHVRRQVLRWLDVTDRINYVQTGCPCFPVLRPTRHGTFVGLPVRTVPTDFGVRRCQLDIPRYCLATFRRRAFGYAGSKAWNSLPDYLKLGNLSMVS